MTDLTRRNFFRLTVGAAAAVAVPSFAGAAPMIYCDGIHDDVPGLTALFRGDVVEFADPGMAQDIGWVGDTLHLGGRTFNLKTTLKIEAERPITAENATFVSHGADPMLHISYPSEWGMVAYAPGLRCNRWEMTP